MSNFTNKLNNLAINSSGQALSNLAGGAMGTLQGKLANGGRDRHCKFYYDYYGGGSIVQVALRGVVGGIISNLKDEAVNAFNSLYDKKTKHNTIGSEWVGAALEKQAVEEKEYGKMPVNGGKNTVFALDDWGDICPDALMLGIKVDEGVRIRQRFPSSRVGQSSNGSFFSPAGNKTFNQDIDNDIPRSDTLVWYDTTAIVTINSDKNMVVSRVAGRDYSRKELVSNGDIKFSVSGQITSKYPDIYPTDEVKKFIKVMRYKGIVQVNNQLLDQFGITHIVIENFNLPSKEEGYKSVQNYSFSAIGLQPEKEINIEEDTVTILKPKTASKEEESTGWKKMLDNQLDGLKSMSQDIVEEAAGIAAGMLERLI